jgi:hypothetical protein
MRLFNVVFLGLSALSVCNAAFSQETADDWRSIFEAQVTRSLTLTPEQTGQYRDAMQVGLMGVATSDHPEFYVLVDRNPKAQVLAIFLGTPKSLELIGATPVSTGTTGRFDYYITPTGVFSLDLQKDFRAEGTKNEHGIRGYGAKGQRIWDIGWFPAVKGWSRARGETGNIRFQIHATDPDYLEPKLGAPGSKGCVRVPATLNKFMDKYGVLDGAYAASYAQTGKAPWIWAKDHVQTRFSGNVLVVTDSASPDFGKHIALTGAAPQ